MLRNRPLGRYTGLTVILSNPSRMDKIYLLSANGGVLFNDCLYPELNSMMCDVRVMEDKEPFIEGTKAVLLLGEAAMHEWCKDTVGNTLNEMRGSVLEVRGLPAIASYLPQDAADIVNHEKKHNELAQDFDSGESEYSISSDDEDEGDIKRFSPTKRSNYYFWLKRDVWKIKKILGGFRPSTIKASYILYPPAQQVLNLLTNTKGGTLYFDMETDYEEQNLLCFSFSFDGVNIYCVPILDNNYRPAYSSYHLIMRALAIAIRDNLLVAHNGSGFDFFVLGFKYHIPVYNCYDTMLSMHRCFPCVEKSLGHCTSYWTWERFHKDSDSHSYFTREHMMQKLQYCGKDVFTMFLIKQEIDKYAKTIPGLEDSIQCANKSIVPYLLMSLQGIEYDNTILKSITNENDRLMMQYIRMMGLLIGEEGLMEMKSYIKSFKGYFTGGNAQACAYFHSMLDYQVLFRSPKTGNPTLGKKILYRLAMKYPDNPVIAIILAYRKIAKMTSCLKFIPWKDDNGKIYTPPEEQQLTWTKVN